MRLPTGATGGRPEARASGNGKLHGQVARRIAAVHSGLQRRDGRSVPPECDARKPSARPDAEVLERQVRRAALGLCRSEMDVVCMLPLSRETCGVAQSARGPKIAGWCPHPTGSRLRFSSPGHGRLKTASGFIRHGPVLALTIRERQGDSACTPRPPRIRKAARHRPVSTPALTAGRRWPAQGARISPVAGLADHSVGASRSG